MEGNKWKSMYCSSQLALFTMILNYLFNSVQPPLFKYWPSPPKLRPHSLRPSFIPNAIVLSSSKCSSYHFKCYRWTPIKACMADREIDMIKTKDGVYTAKPKKVVVLWDLDNKPPRGPPYEAALALKAMAQKFGEVIDISAYANQHAFIHLPEWVIDERRESRQMDFLERKGLSTPAEPYICSVCGRKCKTNMDLRKHFRQLHERERQKKLNRMRCLKGKKRQRYKERFIDGNEKYNEAARRVLRPKVGYGLAQELRRAGVFVKTVKDKPQAADWALKKQMMHSMTRGVDWMVLVSDDSDFSAMLRKVRESNLGTVVVGDQDRSLGRHSDIWLPWNRVENGEIKESDLELNRQTWREFDGMSDGVSVSEFDGGLTEENLQEFVGRMESDNVRISSFSDDEEGFEEDDDWIGARLGRSCNANGQLKIGNSVDDDDDNDDGGDDDEDEGDYLLDSEDEGGSYL